MKRRLTAGLAALALLTAGCGGSDKAEEPTTTSTTSATTTTTPTGPPPFVKITPVMRFDNPTAMAQRHDDNAFYVAEKPGRVRVLRDGVVGDKPVLDISSEVSNEGERGLLGLTFAPNSRLFYVYFTDKTGTIHVTEFELGADDVVDMHTRRDLLTIPHPRTNHNGGQLSFGPDGHMYIGVGDGGGSGDPDKAGQNRTVLLGKILRINPKPSGNLPYTIPYDNPFARQQGARGEIWAYGLRNPWRFSFDKNTGDTWIADVGQQKWEEINYTPKDPKGGQNYGWSLREGRHEFYGNKPTGAIDPVHEYNHDNGACSVTGGYAYRGTAIDGMQSRYLFGDYCSGELWALTRKGTEWSSSALMLDASTPAKFPKLQSFGQDRNGELYLLSGDGSLSRIDAA